MIQPPRLLLTSGEPAGVGPELIIQLAQRGLPVPWAVIADPEHLQQLAQHLQLPVRVQSASIDRAWPDTSAQTINVIPLNLNAPTQAGVLNVENAAFVKTMLDMASHAALNKSVDAIITAPVHKGILNDAGIPFSGHTELFAEQANTEVLMLLACEQLRVALLTTHMPLYHVAAAITAEKLERTIRLYLSELQRQFNITHPRLAVLGLNPHAGEGGHMGREEIDTIEPVLKRLRAEGMNLLGPLSADTAFTPDKRTQYDAVLAMYHDQGLPVLKTLGFHRSVNITLGLPYIRTSVDHGTALDIAGKGVADIGSLHYACEVAIQMHHAQRAS